MQPLFDNECFRTDFDRLAQVSLNPARHSAPNALVHSQLVAQQAARLAELSWCKPSEVECLHQLGFVHDIGKVAGTANPSKSVEMLPRYGITDPAFIELVRCHDTNLPWFIAMSKGEPPSDKAWRKLAGRVDMRLLCLFMVADRVDCPGGWRANEALVWFLDEAGRRGLVDVSGMNLDVEDSAPEQCAGAAVFRYHDGQPQILAMRVREYGYELPKGHVEPGESPRAAAVRELAEEAGLAVTRPASAFLGSHTYAYEHNGGFTRKNVNYFFVEETGATHGTVPPRTLRLRWIDEADLTEVPWVNPDLISIARRGFALLRERPPDSRSP